MKKYSFSIDIDAPVEKVWHTMLDKETYKQWTAPFNPAGSWFEGDWSKDSEIRFIGPDPKDPTQTGGMLAVVEENKPYEFISLRHEAEIVNGEVRIGENASWVGAHENYTFSEKGGSTSIGIDIDLDESFAEYMIDAWPKSLQILKELSEKAE